ncbi:YtxH domain-containing protein [Halobacillus litoralis]|uniref:YtxH domain-containing protein n=1 Tax=Halobacillus litoralis TaxID=45668 RepID=A0A845DXX6_9BACI|nr:MULTISPECIES: YtxH domain-containing protein [Halobacillus]MYL21305.1 YtxH domain-containing protein [Halobacillus litoralis]MYL30251.1 YtxH domain-containing protein [Halobacillus halophilus]MYL38243.1 YtxH domain-containing protein [Halobacillus litoralis]
MGQTLWKGILIGAAAGAAAALIDKDTRTMVGQKSKAAGSKCREIAASPSEAVHSLRLSYESFSKQLNKGVEDLLELLDKAESMLNKVGEINQEVKDQLRAADNSDNAS